MTFEYQYRPLLKNEVRLIELLPGTSSDDICFRIVHEVLIPTSGETAKSTRPSLYAVQKTLPKGWRVFETPEGKRFYWDGVVPEPTTFSHPDESVENKSLAVNDEVSTISTSQPRFEALSYTWSPEIPWTAARVVGSDRQGAESQDLGYMNVGASLSTALKSLRYTDRTRSLWVDAVCINQRDLIERAAQVRRMGLIYGQAFRVVVWLGPASASSNLAMRTLEYLGRQAEIATEGWKFRAKGAEEQDWWRQDQILPYNESQWMAIAEFFRRPWFERVWTFQEIALASPQSVVHCGSDEVLYYHLRRAQAVLFARPGLPDGLNEVLWACRDPAFGCKFNTTTTLTGTCRRLKCSDPRDKLYGMLSLFGNAIQNMIQPSYTSVVSTVYKDMCLAFVAQSKRLDLLAQCWLTGEEEDGDSANPSWVTPFNQSATTRITVWFAFQASGYSPASYRYLAPNILEVEGVYHATVTTVHRTSEPRNALRNLYDLLYLDLKGDYPTGRETRLDAFLRTLVLDDTTDRFQTGDDSVRIDELREMVHAHIRSQMNRQQREEKGEAVEEEEQVQPAHNAILKEIARLLHNTAFIQTDKGGYYGVANNTTQPGDHIVVLLGCWMPMVLRPITNANSNGNGNRSSSTTFKVVGTCYVHGILDGEALLGPLPAGITAGQHLIGPRSTPLYRDQVTGSTSRDDPRLGKLPTGEEWERVEVEPDKDEPLFVDYFHNSRTGETINYDPRMSPEVLRRRNTALRFFKLV